MHGSHLVTQAPGQHTTREWWQTDIGTSLPDKWANLEVNASLTIQDVTSSTCTSNELDPEGMLPFKIGMVDDYLVQIGRKSSPESGSPLQFQVLASGDVYKDLSQCNLNLKCWVLKADGTAFEMMWAGDMGAAASTAMVGPMNLLFHSLFKQVDLLMNDMLVASSEHLPLQGLPDHPT